MKPLTLKGRYTFFARPALPGDDEKSVSSFLTMEKVDQIKSGLIWVALKQDVTFIADPDEVCFDGHTNQQMLDKWRSQ